jgi:sec-independent protein translocase protein TatC
VARRISLAWLKPPKVSPDGVMSLADHLREFRYRVLVSASAVMVGMIGVAFFYRGLLDLLTAPLLQAKASLAVTNPGIKTDVVVHDYFQAFLLVMQLCVVGGLVLTCPFWLYQVWAYIVPALLAKEKKVVIAFLGAAVPLFLFGVAVAYLVLPQGIIVMLQFTPDNMGILNLLDLNNYMTLLLQLMIVFGIGFLVPVFVVGLNLVGIVSGAQLKKARMGVVFGSFIFGAAATPGTDPFSMCALAIPMSILFLIAEAICHANDRRKVKKLKAEGLYIEPDIEPAKP